MELTVYVGDIVLDLTPPPPRIPVTNSDGGEFLDPKTDRTCCFCWVGRGGRVLVVACGGAQKITH